MGFSFGTRRTPDHDDVRRDTSGRRHSNLGVFETSYDAETPDVFFGSDLELQDLKRKIHGFERVEVVNPREKSIETGPRI